MNFSVGSVLVGIFSWVLGMSLAGSFCFWISELLASRGEKSRRSFSMSKSFN